MAKRVGVVAGSHAVVGKLEKYVVVRAGQLRREPGHVQCGRRARI
jgi:hypothetical protein